MSGQGTGLVTGGSGFIASWCVMGLLQQGYATVNPSMVVGPVLSRDFSASVMVVERLMSAARSDGQPLRR